MLRNNPELNITEISDKIGFSSSRYFSKCFKDIYHVSPLAYRKGEEADKDEEEAVNEKIRILHFCTFYDSVCTLLYTQTER